VGGITFVAARLGDSRLCLRVTGGRILGARSASSRARSKLSNVCDDAVDHRLLQFELLANSIGHQLLCLVVGFWSSTLNYSALTLDKYLKLRENPGLGSPVVDHGDNVVVGGQSARLESISKAEQER